MWGNKKTEGEAHALVAAGNTPEQNGAPSNQLSLLDSAKQALVAATSLDEIKVIRDKAEAARKYVESARMGLEMQNQAAEVKLRAERAAGTMLSKLQLAGGDRRSIDADGQVRLEDLGITKHQSARWQREASVPEQAFERFLAETRDAGEELTAAALLRLANQYRKTRARAESDQADVATTTEAVHANLQSIIESGETFACLYANPPWRVASVATSKDTPSVGMTAAELAALPIGRLASEVAHLHLWSPSEQVDEAVGVMDAWGFSYRSCLVWVRQQSARSDYWRRAHELLLLGVRGEQKFVDRRVLSWLRVNRTKQGQKPEKVRKLIERVSPGPYLELFATKQVRGWTVTGGPADAT